MPFRIVRNDITQMAVDAIVNAAQTSLLGGDGGVDAAIHAAAGPALEDACRVLGGCRPGEARITPGFALPCRYVIHTVGPHWRGGLFGEARQLASCYRSSLALAKAHGCESVAFPLISAGTYGFPREKAFKIAMDSIADFLLDNEMTVYLVLYGAESVQLGRKLFAEIQEYIDEHYIEAHAPLLQRRQSCPGNFRAGLDCAPPMSAAHVPAASLARPAASEATQYLNGLFDELDESFQQMLLRKIDESGMTDTQCYKKANVDRKLFSKIRNDRLYKPSKPTAIAFAIALELELPEAEELLRKAGYALSRSSKFDLIVRYFIERRNYNLFEINETLFYYDQNLLGA